MAEKTLLYTRGLLEAHRNGEMKLWRESHQANIRCKKALQNALQNFDEWSTVQSVAAGMVNRFGSDRINWVLANTIQHLYSDQLYDNQFTPDGQAWAANFDIPHNAAHDTSWDFAVYAPPYTLVHFTEAVRGLQVTEPESNENGIMCLQ